jgi:cystathionine beta-synthase
LQFLNEITDSIGNTPLVKLGRLGGHLRHKIFAKCEFMNPGGSVKDRIAAYMVSQAEQDGRLRKGGTIVEATAGNTGIGLAMVASLKGYKLIVVLTAKVSQEKVQLLKTLGAEVIVVPGGKPREDPEHFINKAKEIAQSQGAFLVDQFNNISNVKAHYEGTGPEIWAQTAGKIDALVAGVGTGGTITGVGRFLRERRPSVKLVLADPAGSLLTGFTKGITTTGAPYLVEGIGSDFIPGNLDISLLDSAYAIPDQESVRIAHALLKQESLFVGSSSGCIVAAALRYCEELEGEGKTIVAILPDGGRAYMSTIYDQKWLADHSITID